LRCRSSTTWSAERAGWRDDHARVQTRSIVRLGPDRIAGLVQDQPRLAAARAGAGRDRQRALVNDAPIVDGVEFIYWRGRIVSWSLEP
jgi:hypothetical protein